MDLGESPFFFSSRSSVRRRKMLETQVKNGWNPPTLSFKMDDILYFMWTKLRFSPKIKWDLTNGPLSKLLELLDPQV